MKNNEENCEFTDWVESWDGVVDDGSWEDASSLVDLGADVDTLVGPFPGDLVAIRAELVKSELERAPTEPCPPMMSYCDVEELEKEQFTRCGPWCGYCMGCDACIDADKSEQEPDSEPLTVRQRGIEEEPFELVEERKVQVFANSDLTAGYWQLY
jgi:hypothetical protein